MRRIFLSALAAMLCVAGSSRAATNDLFRAGIEAAQAGDFATAATAFESAAKQQPSAGAFLNLGLAEWQRGHAGAAILAWERAKWIDPFDRRAANNLKFARTLSLADEPQLKWFETASTWLPPNAWVWLAGASLWLAIAALVLPRFLRRQKSGWHQWLAALSCGAFLFSMTANFGVVSRTNIGFVVKKNTPLLLTPTKAGEPVSTLNEGLPARKIKTHAGYFFVSTAYGSGWIERKNLTLLNPE
jgi:tetratricopeptide (TPR) repeat protein